MDQLLRQLSKTSKSIFETIEAFHPDSPEDEDILLDILGPKLEAFEEIREQLFD